MAILTSVLIADGDDFASRPVAQARLDFGGVSGDLHAGLTRKACARVPWHPRGTAIANTRQLSIVSVEECAALAGLLGLPGLDPGLLGANLVVEGIEALSALAPATRMQLASGATVFITEENAPCRQPGRKLAAVFGRPALEFDFVKAAIGRRGLVGLVEREGEITAGEEIRLIRPPARRLPVAGA